MIYFTSDLHLGHDKEFVWGARGFQSLTEMENAIIERWNSVVTDEDEVFVLGDVYMGDDGDHAIELLKRLNGTICIVLGNHDSQAKIGKLSENGFQWEYPSTYTYKLKNKKRKWHFYLSHYPSYTSNLEADPYDCVINLHGHTHSKAKFFEDRPYMYNVALDAHDCTPVSIDSIIEDYIKEVKRCQQEVGQ